MVENLTADMREVKTRLSSLETTVNERLYDTRPQWADLMPRITNIEKQLVGVNDRFKVVARQLFDMQGTQESFDRRLADVESKVS